MQPDLCTCPTMAPPRWGVSVCRGRRGSLTRSAACQAGQSQPAPPAGNRLPAPHLAHPQGGGLSAYLHARLACLEEEEEARALSCRWEVERGPDAGKGWQLEHRGHASPPPEGMRFYHDGEHCGLVGRGQSHPKAHLHPPMMTEPRWPLLLSVPRGGLRLLVGQHLGAALHLCLRAWQGLLGHWEAEAGQALPCSACSLASPQSLLVRAGHGQPSGGGRACVLFAGAACAPRFCVLMRNSQ